ncbi:hypothetical protein RB195_020844 [Necator americanus]|uniref:Secreted protein n=1 Tax=Necator americanus TaxID=51031 RepID=A0ABR1CNI3_NECAM
MRSRVHFNSESFEVYLILIEKTMNTWMFAALCLIILAVFCPGISQPMPDPTDFQYNMDEPTIDEMQIRNSNERKKRAYWAYGAVPAVGFRRVAYAHPGFIHAPMIHAGHPFVWG